LVKIAQICKNTIKKISFKSYRYFQSYFDAKSLVNSRSGHHLVQFLSFWIRIERSNFQTFVCTKKVLKNDLRQIFWYDSYCVIIRANRCFYKIIQWNVWEYQSILVLTNHKMNKENLNGGKLLYLGLPSKKWAPVKKVLWIS
jgi:hypothetical protein